MQQDGLKFPEHWEVNDNLRVQLPNIVPPDQFLVTGRVHQLGQEKILEILEKAKAFTDFQDSLEHNFIPITHDGQSFCLVFDNYDDENGPRVVITLCQSDER